LRDQAEFFAYPTLNAAGRFAGTSRATVENPNQDPNGLWSPAKWATHPDIRASGEAMLADVVSTPGDLDVFIDFHSTIPSAPGDDFAFIEYEQGDNLADFWLELRDLQPNVLDTDSTGTSSTSANFADLLLGAQVDITFETQFGKNRPLSYYHTLGANFGIAFYNAWVQVENPAAADFDEDGDVASDDLQTWLQNFGTTATATHFQGDADADLDTDGADFLTWQQQFGSGIPSATTLQAIPEPSAGWLGWMIGLTTCLSRWRLPSTTEAGN
jgi:hypothetical protein